MGKVLRLLARIVNRIEDLFVNVIIQFFEHGHPKDRVRFGFTVGVPEKKESTHMPLSLKITSEQKINVTLNPVTATGKPAKLDGKPDWSVVSGSSTLVVADDGMSADLVSSDDPGDTQFLVKADALLGEGVSEISDTIALRVDNPLAESLGLKAGDAVPKA